MKVLSSHKELVVWQKAISLAILIYGITEAFPRSELYGLTSQMRRSAVSIASNIAEGRRRGTQKDFVQFLRIAYGSGAELETQLTIADKVIGLTPERRSETCGLLDEIMRMLNVIIRRLSSSEQKPG